MIPTPEQQAIFDEVANGWRHVIVEALAGTGKTTTIKEAAQRLPSDLRALYLVFNKRNAEEAAGKMPYHVQVSTFNAFGHKLCGEYFRTRRVDKWKVRNILEPLVGTRVGGKKFAKTDMFAWEKLISLCRGHAKLDVEAAVAAVPALCDKYDLDVPEDLGMWGGYYGTVIGDVASRDFDDQVFMPIKHRLPMPKYDVVFVDESQDLNPIKIEIVRALGTRTVVVGDKNQAIYGFAGADTAAIATLGEMLSGLVPPGANGATASFVTRLPLTINYRCGRAIIAAAQPYMPGLRAWDGAAEGSVVEVGKERMREDVTEGDFVIGRCTAPLVVECLKAISAGKRAKVLGREIGEGLLRLVGGCESWDDFSGKVNKEVRRATEAGRSGKVEMLCEQMETVEAVLDFVGEWSAVRGRLESIFSDDAEAGTVVCLTAHKAKGLEADTVWLLREKFPHPRAETDWQREQESNLMGVAITRARKKLFFVT